MPQNRGLKAHRDGMASCRYRESAEGDICGKDLLRAAVEVSAPAGVIRFGRNKVGRRIGFHFELKVERFVAQRANGLMWWAN